MTVSSQSDVYVPSDIPSALYCGQTGVQHRYFIRTFGCQLNENDSEKIAGVLDECGFTQAEDADQADLVVFNTCSVRENADDRLFGNLGRLKAAKQERPELRIALCGCMMRQPHHVEKIRKSFPFVDLVFGTSDIHRLPELLHRLYAGEKRVYEVGADDRIAEGIPMHRQRRFRALCSIMYGCDNFCSYCIVPYVRGRERSRSAPEILRELEELSGQGYREVMLLGQNVNSYGRDQGPDAPDFPSLLAMAAQIPGFDRIRFMTSHPKDCTRRLIDTIADHPSIERHLHLPLQSGSNRVLREMNRGYSREEYLDIATYARDRIPGLTISTDLIVGFPGETEEDFVDTLDMMDRIRFDSAFTFIYSPRKGTPAAERTDIVDPEAVEDRFRRLVDKQDAHSLASNESVVGTLQRVLIEGTSTKPGIHTGRTSHNRLVNFTVDPPAGTDMENMLADVRVTAAHAYYLEGAMEGVPL